MDIQRIAEEIDACQRSGKEMDKVTISYPSLSVEEAYAIQKGCVQHAIDRGDQLTGWKMGLTSRAKQVSMGVKEPIYGRLTQSMELTEPVLHLEGLIHPRVEPELAFVLKKELGGGEVTPRDVWAATECVLPAIEVIDSRYKNFSFTLVDVIADNASSSKFIVGDQGFSPYTTAWDEVGVSMMKNGEVVQTGAGAAVLGHPVRSVVELVKMLNRDGISIQPGSVVLTGAVTDAVSVSEGDRIAVQFDQLGSLRFRVQA
ncbi:2-oxo-3-hexenedioate decarboxylase [Scopulibacillus darangshiensis]|uniref:2-oxo-3-hexenedioate decarboxylase n=1 Tax=Scopulibacillus darangshiensis TaxID=442528 RepID=A0A4R2P2N2_9BACL|nr:fumarylacetoacetate hydrolase family protein [Scopulibacillus darangshiensis]TCP28989.1 2-oxo-3-hexenedioate decarboxylase [Scopulibacillus darangshiensis]